MLGEAVAPLEPSAEESGRVREPSASVPAAVEVPGEALAFDRRAPARRCAVAPRPRLVAGAVGELAGAAGGGGGGGRGAGAAGATGAWVGGGADAAVATGADWFPFPLPLPRPLPLPLAAAGVPVSVVLRVVVGALA